VNYWVKRKIGFGKLTEVQVEYVEKFLVGGEGIEPSILDVLQDL
jgi:hypothetical protein